MADIVVKVIDASCGWGPSTDCCDELGSAINGYAEGATWGLPLQMRLQVLEAYVHEHTGCHAGFEEATLQTLAGPELVVALTAMSEGKDLPFVIVADELACSDVLDPDAIAAAVQRQVSARST